MNELISYIKDVTGLEVEDQIELPESIQEDMASFMNLMEENPPQTKDFLKAMGITAVSTEQLIEQLKFSFELN